MEKLRPEGAAQGADHPGFGTLLFGPTAGERRTTVSPPARPAAPGGLIARSIPSGIRLTWVAPAGAEDYAVARAPEAEGAFAVIAPHVKATEFEDSLVTAGAVYRYVVSAANATGAGPASVPQTVGAGLPGSWSNRDIGSVAVAGSAQFDGQTYSVEGAGTGIDGRSDSFQLLYAARAGNQTFSARFVPQTNSQSAEMGLTMRASLAPDSAHVSLLVMAVAGALPERPDWAVRLISRSEAGATSVVNGDSGALPPPLVAYGRLLQPCWLRLARAADTFTAWTSPDGLAWKQVGLVHLPLPSSLLIGLSVSSRLPRTGTAVNFDHVPSL